MPRDSEHMLLGNGHTITQMWTTRSLRRMHLAFFFKQLKGQLAGQQTCSMAHHVSPRWEFASRFEHHCTPRCLVTCYLYLSSSLSLLKVGWLILGHQLILPPKNEYRWEHVWKNALWKSVNSGCLFVSQKILFLLLSFVQKSSEGNSCSNLLISRKI